MDRAATAARPVRRTQRERRETSYRRMLAAAVKLIERQGSSRTTLAQVGELSGYSYGLVSHRFGSKEALVHAVTREAQASFARHEMADADRHHGLEAVLILVERYLRAVVARSRNALYVLIGEALGAMPEIRREISAADTNFRAGVRKSIEQGIALGEIRPEADADAQAAVIVATLRGLAIQHLIDASAFDPDAVSRELRSSVTRSLAAPNGSTRKRRDA